MAAGAPRKPTKIDVELRALDLKYATRRTIILALGWIVGLLAAAVPLLVVKNTIEPFAGKTTHVDVNVAIAITVGLSLALNGVQWIKGLGRKDETKKLRTRIEELEERLGLPPRSL